MNMPKSRDAQAKCPCEGNFKCIFARTCENTEQLQIFTYRVHV